MRGATIRGWLTFSAQSSFQSTLPVRGATTACWWHYYTIPISIHAPRAGSDFFWFNIHTLLFHFNPRSPCGERQGDTGAKGDPGDISIHAPRAGSDRGQPRTKATGSYFNPRSPCGERQHNPRAEAARADFNPRSPCGERLKPGYAYVHFEQFQSTLPVRGATV